MQFRPILALSRCAGRRDGRRVPGRSFVDPHSVMSSFGPVIDLSAGGMRVLSVRRRSRRNRFRRHAYEDLMPVKVWACKKNAVTVQAKVVWTLRLGYRRHVLGLAFVDVNESVKDEILKLAADHARSRAVA